MERLNELESKILDDYMEEVIRKIIDCLNVMDFHPKLSKQAKEIIIKYITVQAHDSINPKFTLCLGINGSMLKNELKLYIQRDAIDRFLKRVENK